MERELNSKRSVTTLQGGPLIIQNYQNGIYNGNSNKGVCHGKGVFWWDSGELYFGEWEDAKIHGEGIFFFPYGGYLKGFFFKNKINGAAFLRFPNGDFYQGFWRHGKLDGKCFKYFADFNSWALCTYSKGVFQKCLNKGRGRPNITFEEKLSMHIDSTFIEQSGDHVGVIHYGDGGKYYGVIQGGVPHGLGITYYLDGKFDAGLYEDGILQGAGRLIMQNGDICEGYVKDGQINGKGFFYKKEADVWIFGNFKSHGDVEILHKVEWKRKTHLFDLPQVNLVIPNDLFYIPLLEEPQEETKRRTQRSPESTQGRSQPSSRAKNKPKGKKLDEEVEYRRLLNFDSTPSNSSKSNKSKPKISGSHYKGNEPESELDLDPEKALLEQNLEHDFEMLERATEEETKAQPTSMSQVKMSADQGEGGQQAEVLGQLSENLQRVAAGLRESLQEGLRPNEESQQKQDTKSNLVIQIPNQETTQKEEVEEEGLEFEYVYQKVDSPSPRIVTRQGAKHPNIETKKSAVEEKPTKEEEAGNLSQEGSPETGTRKLNRGVPSFDLDAVKRDSFFATEGAPDNSNTNYQAENAGAQGNIENPFISNELPGLREIERRQSEIDSPAFSKIRSRVEDAPVLPLKQNDSQRSDDQKPSSPTSPNRHYRAKSAQPQQRQESIEDDNSMYSISRSEFGPMTGVKGAEARKNTLSEDFDDNSSFQVHKDALNQSKEPMQSENLMLVEDGKDGGASLSERKLSNQTPQESSAEFAVKESLHKLNESSNVKPKCLLEDKEIQTDFPVLAAQPKTTPRKIITIQNYFTEIPSDEEKLEKGDPEESQKTSEENKNEVNEAKEEGNGPEQNTDIPIIKKKESEKDEKPILEPEKSEKLILESEKDERPILESEKDEKPILESEKDEKPILESGSSKQIDDEIKNEVPERLVEENVGGNDQGSLIQPQPQSTESTPMMEDDQKLAAEDSFGKPVIEQSQHITDLKPRASQTENLLRNQQQQHEDLLPEESKTMNFEPSPNPLTTIGSGVRSPDENTQEGYTQNNDDNDSKPDANQRHHRPTDSQDSTKNFPELSSKHPSFASNQLPPVYTSINPSRRESQPSESQVPGATNSNKTSQSQNPLQNDLPERSSGKESRQSKSQSQNYLEEPRNSDTENKKNLKNENSSLSNEVEPLKSSEPETNIKTVSDATKQNDVKPINEEFDIRVKENDEFVYLGKKNSNYQQPSEELPARVENNPAAKKEELLNQPVNEQSEKPTTTTQKLRLPRVEKLLKSHKDEEPNQGHNPNPNFQGTTQLQTQPANPSSTRAILEDKSNASSRKPSEISNTEHNHPTSGPKSGKYDLNTLGQSTDLNNRSQPYAGPLTSPVVATIGGDGRSLEANLQEQPKYFLSMGAMNQHHRPTDSHDSAKNIPELSSKHHSYASNQFPLLYTSINPSPRHGRGSESQVPDTNNNAFQSPNPVSSTSNSGKRSGIYSADGTFDLKAAHQALDEILNRTKLMQQNNSQMQQNLHTISDYFGQYQPLAKPVQNDLSVKPKGLRAEKEKNAGKPLADSGVHNTFSGTPQTFSGIPQAFSRIPIDLNPSPILKANVSNHSQLSSKNQSFYEPQPTNNFFTRSPTDRLELSEKPSARPTDRKIVDNMPLENLPPSKIIGPALTLSPEKRSNDSFNYSPVATRLRDSEQGSNYLHSMDQRPTQQLEHQKFREMPHSNSSFNRLPNVTPDYRQFIESSRNINYNEIQHLPEDSRSEAEDERVPLVDDNIFEKAPDQRPVFDKSILRLKKEIPIPCTENPAKSREQTSRYGASTHEMSSEKRNWARRMNEESAWTDSRIESAGKTPEEGGSPIMPRAFNQSEVERESRRSEKEQNPIAVFEDPRFARSGPNEYFPNDRAQQRTPRGQEARDNDFYDIMKLDLEKFKKYTQSELARIEENVDDSIARSLETITLSKRIPTSQSSRDDVNSPPSNYFKMSRPLTGRNRKEANRKPIFDFSGQPRSSNEYRPSSQLPRQEYGGNDSMTNGNRPQKLGIDALDVEDRKLIRKSPSKSRISSAQDRDSVSVTSSRAAYERTSSELDVEERLNSITERARQDIARRREQLDRENCVIF